MVMMVGLVERDEGSLGYYLLFDMLSCVSAAITLRFCRVYIEEGFLD